MGTFYLGFILILLNVVIAQAKGAQAKSTQTQEYAKQAKRHIAQMHIADSQVRFLQSDIVNQEYQLLVKLPLGYGQSDKRYPVIYFLDAQWDFPLMVSTHGQSYYDGFVPNAILVGIQWGGENPDPNVLRERDFTPTHMNEVANSGGAGKFLQFIKQELIPFIGKEYRTSDKRVLMGSSYGGLFTLYAMFNEPNVFDGYIPTSSASAWDNDILYSYAKTFSKKKLTKPIRLYSAIGEFDSLMPAFNHLSTFFEKQKFSGVSFKFERLNGLGHASLKSAGNTWGLHYVFAKPKLALSHTQLLGFVGRYKGDISNAFVDVLIDKGLLHIRIGERTHPLHASTVLSFYQEGEFLQASFDSAAKPESMIIERFFGVERFSRVDE